MLKAQKYLMKRCAEDSTFAGVIVLLTAVLAELHTGVLKAQFGLDSYLWPVVALHVAAIYMIASKE